MSKQAFHCCVHGMGHKIKEAILHFELRASLAKPAHILEGGGGLYNMKPGCCFSCALAWHTSKGLVTRAPRSIDDLLLSSRKPIEKRTHSVCA